MATYKHADNRNTGISLILRTDTQSASVTSHPVHAFWRGLNHGECRGILPWRERERERESGEGRHRQGQRLLWDNHYLSVEHAFWSELSCWNGCQSKYSQFTLMHLYGQNTPNYPGNTRDSGTNPSAKSHRYVLGFYMSVLKRVECHGTLFIRPSLTFPTWA